MQVTLTPALKKHLMICLDISGCAYVMAINSEVKFNRIPSDHIIVTHHPGYYRPDVVRTMFIIKSKNRAAYR